MRDHGKPVGLEGASGKLTLLAGSAKTEATLAPAGDRLEARGAFPAAPGARVVATVQLAGEGRRTCGPIEVKGVSGARWPRLP